MTSQKQVQGYSVSERMNRLPASNYFLRLVARICTGGLFEFYELFMVGSVGAAMVSAKIFTTQSLAYFVGAGFLGMFVGTTLFGKMSDKVGRRDTYVYSLLVYSLFTILMAFSSSASLIVIFRLLAGVGVGAQLVIIDTYIAEFTPSKHRGFYIAFSQFIMYLAVPIVSLLAYLLVPTHFLMAGWRWVVLIGGLGSIIVWWVRQGIPESPRWQEDVGMTKQADATMSKLEDIIEKETGPLPKPQKTKISKKDHVSFFEILKPPYRGRTIMLSVFNLFQSVGFYGFASWVPSLLISEGVTLINSLLYTFIIALANPVGPIIGMFSSDKLQRKTQIVMVAITIAIIGTLFSFMRLPFFIILFGIIITLLNSWFSSLFHLYQAEVFPTRIRATGVGFTYGWSRLSSAFSGIVIAHFLVSFGVIGVFVFISISMLICAITIGAFGPRTNKKDIEEV